MRRTTSSRSGCPTCTASAATSRPAACSRSASPSWQVLVALVVGIVIVQVFCNLVAKPSQETGVPYPVINRAVVRRARREHPRDHPRPDRGGLVRRADLPRRPVAEHHLPEVHGPASAALLDHTVPRARRRSAGSPTRSSGCRRRALFWSGMETIRRFIDWAGPAVYVVMIVLAVYLVAQGRLEQHLASNLSRASRSASGARSRSMLGAIALVVSLLLRPDAELRRLLPLRQELRGGQARQLARACRSTSCSSRS